jgi:hypothetical protein
MSMDELSDGLVRRAGRCRRTTGGQVGKGLFDAFLQFSLASLKCDAAAADT